MNFLQNLKIRTKLNVLVILVSLLLIGIGATGLVGMNASNSALSTVYNDHLIAINQLNEIRNYQMQMRIDLSNARQETDAFEVLSHIDKVRSSIFQIENLLKTYNERNISPAEKKLLTAFVDARLIYGRTGVMPMIDLLQAEKYAQADTLLKTVTVPTYKNASQGIDNLIQFQVDNAKNEFERVTVLTKTIRTVSIVSIAIGLTLAILIGFIITRSVSCGVRELDRAATCLANGDLTARAKWDSKDELGGVARVFNTMATEFSSLIKQVHQSADQVANAAEIQTNGAEKVSIISKNQTQQASIAATSIEGLNSAVKEVAQKTAEVVAAANEASVMAAEGQQVVNNAANGIQQVSRTVSASAEMIEALGQRSNQIGQIVKVIKDIADQTNLLALNAAIEAARAGEQGRGFAVVADEVRKLAERTTAATSEISQMISAIQSETGSAVSTMEKGSVQVSEGVAMANQAGKSLEEINNSVKRVVEMVQQIANATRSQSESSDEITSRVEHIAKMALENAESVDKTTHSSHDLQKLSGHLQALVSKFKL
ncbi:methyl-accepting chemotaxis protein [Sulfurirhabdus autotrophica]|uniref:Methyl-accepting chemotaxis protein n=1 Tax=Sulfurirhabdus autotrophica TaxID=1706046 RepID=A0A4R3YE34_9PROT|nr:methyl-accepting chemotaxis protein [Sulfurirhabdus autotrophica]TCV90785.1 methyl-accepting chemotaxis protein [Sulfurirhabdus autotrophica]